MSFALYLIGFLIVIAGLARGAMVAGVPQTYIIIGAVILFGIGILSAVKRTRPKDPPSPPSP
jgi:type IV secretory pathway VirB3-like protein